MIDPTAREYTTEPAALPSGARVALIANPGAGRYGETVDDCAAVLADAGLKVARWRGGAEPAALCAAVRRARAASDAVVIGGGDGTLHQALPALLGAGPPLGVLPLGTANDFARTLGLPLDPIEAARGLTRWRVRRVDVGDADGRCFLNVAHVGLGVVARQALATAGKRHIGAWSYPLALVAAVRRYRGFTAHVVVDGVDHVLRLRHLTVGNGRCFGGGVPVAEDAGICDAMLDVYAVRAMGLPGLLRAGAAIWRGRDGRGVWRATGRTVTIRTRRAHPLIADGEAGGRTPVTVRVRPGALPVLAP